MQQTLKTFQFSGQILELGMGISKISFLEGQIEKD